MKEFLKHINSQDIEQLKQELKELYTSFEWVRDSFIWTKRYDKDMKLLPEPVTAKLKNLDTGHLEALADYRVGSYMRYLFLMELEYREKNN